MSSNRFLKHDCHRMMRSMWGDDKKGNTKAYIWLEVNLGKKVHFSDITDNSLLVEIHQALVDRMKRKGHEYMTGMKYEDLDALEKEERV